MARRIECRHCGTFNAPGTVCMCQARSKKVFPIEKLRGELDKAVSLLEGGHELDAILQLKAMQLGISIVDECK